MNFAKRMHESATSALFRYGAAVPLVIAAALITERKRAEEALRGAEQLAREQIAALMRSLDVLASRDRKRTDKISSRMDTSDR